MLCTDSDDERLSLTGGAALGTAQHDVLRQYNSEATCSLWASIIILTKRNRGYCTV